MAFVTKVDYSDNRQVKQFQLTNTNLSGATEFGLPFSALTSGVDESTVITTGTLTNIESTFSGNTNETIFFFDDSRLNPGVETIEPITRDNENQVQVGIGYEGNNSTVIDGNTVNLSYTGATFDLNVTSLTEITPDVFTGTTNSEVVTLLSGGSIDFKSRTIWVDVNGITRTDKLILLDEPEVDNTITSVLARDSEGEIRNVDISSASSFVTGFTYNSNQNSLTIERNGLSDLSTYIDAFSGLTVNGDIEVTNNINSNSLSTVTLSGETIFSGGTDLLEIFLTESDINYTTGATFNSSTGVLEFTDLSGNTYDVNIGVEDYVTGYTFNPTTGDLTLNRLNGGGVFGNLDGRYSLLGHTHTVSDITDFPTNISYFNNDIGYITGFTDTTYTAGVGLELNGTEFTHFDTSSQIDTTNPVGSFVRNIELDDFGHITQIFSGSETDPTVPSHVKNITTGDTNNWTTAYNDKINTITVTGDANKVITLTQQDGTTLTANFEDNNDGSTTDIKINALDFSASTGVLTATRDDAVTVTTSLDGRYSLLGHTHTISDITDFPTNISYFNNDAGYITGFTDTTYTAGNGLDLNGTIFSHSDTSTQVSSNNSGRTYIQSIGLDTFGHITNIETSTETVINSDDYVTGSSFNISTGDLTLNRLEGGSVVENLDGRYSLTGHTHVISDITDFPTDVSYFNNDVGYITGFTDTNFYLDNLSFNLSTGILTASVNGTTNQTVDLDGRYTLTGHTHVISDITDFPTDVSYFNNDVGYITGFTNTTYTTSVIDSTGDAIIRLSGSDSSTDDITLIGGSNVSLSTSGDTITINGISDDTTYTAGDGLDLNGTEFAHSDTSSQASSNNSGRTYIQNIGLDTFGHITGLTTSSETVINTDDYVTGATFNTTTGDLTLNRLDGDSITENLDDRYALTGHTHTVSDITDFPTNVSYFNNDVGYITGFTNTFVTNFTYDNSNIITIEQNNSEPDLSIDISIMSGLTVNGDISATTTSSQTFITPNGNSNQWNEAYNNSITGTSLVDETIELSKLSGGTFDINLSPLTKLAKDTASTGILFGGELSVNANDNTKFDIEAGIGYVVDDTVSPSTVTEVNFGPFTGLTVTNLNTTFATDIAIDINGNVIQQSTYTDEDLRSLIFLGGLDHSSQVDIANAFPIQIPANAPASSLSELATAVGDINKSGNVYGPNDTNLLGIDKSAGQFFAYGVNNVNNKNEPHIVTNPSLVNIEFSYVYDNGSGIGEFTAPTTNINPNNYDDGSGTLATLNPNDWSVHRILFFPNSNKTFVQYGTEVFNKLNDALNNPAAFKFKSLIGIQTASVRGFIVVREGETDLSSEDTVFIGANKFGLVESAGGTSETSWGEITGLIENQVDLKGELDKTIDSISVTGDTTKTITLTRINGDVIESTFTDNNTTYTAGDGLDLIGTEFSHSDTSTLSSTTNSGRTYIQNINLDDFGHITGLTTSTETVVNTDDYVNDVTFSASTGDLTLTTLSGNTIVENLDGRYLELDQTTPQSIDNGIPLLNAGIVDFNDEFQLVNKGYVDNAVNFIADYYFNDTPDALGGIYYQMTTNDLGGAESLLTTPTLTSGNNQPLFNFITQNELGTDNLNKGVYEVHTHAYKTGTKSVSLYTSIYVRTVGGSETLVGTSLNSKNITLTDDEYDFTISIPNSVEINPTDKLVVEFFVNVGDSGSNPTVTLGLEGGNNSRVSIPIESAVLSQIFVRQDGTTELKDNWNAGDFNITAQRFDTSGGTSNEWNEAYDDSITGLTVTGSSTKTITLNQRDGTSLSANFIDESVAGGSGDVVTGMTFNDTTGDLNLNTLSGNTITENLDGRYTLTGHTHTISDITNFPTDVSYFNNDVGYITGFTDTNFYLDNLSFNTSTGILTASVNGTTNQTVDLNGRYALTGHTHTISDITDFPTNISYFNNDVGYITGFTNTTYTAGNGLDLNGTIFSHSDTSTQTSSNNSGRTYIQSIDLDTFGHITGLTASTETVVNTDDYVTGATFNTSTGDLTLNRLDGGSVVENLDDRYSLTGHTHVISDITDFGDYVNKSGDTMTGDLTIDNSSTLNLNNNGLRINEGGSQYSIVRGGGDGILTFIGTQSGVSGYKFLTNTTEEALTITNGGSVGIGTSNPSEALDVDGNVNITGILNIDNRLDGHRIGELFIDYASGGNPSLSSTGGKLIVSGDLDIQSNGKILGGFQSVFGLDIATQRLDTPLRFSTSPLTGGTFVEAMRVTGQGDVGIGTTTPTEKLEVDGNVKAIQFIGDGSQLTGIPNSYVTGTTFNTSTGDLTLTRNGGLPDITTSLDGRYITTDEVVGEYLPLSGGTLTGGVTGTTLTFGNTTLEYQENNDVDSVATEVIATTPSSNIDAAFFNYVVKKGINLRAGVIMAVHDGTNIEFTDNSTSDLGDTTEVVFDMDLFGGDLRLLANVNTDNWEIKVFIKTI